MDKVKLIYVKLDTLPSKRRFYKTVVLRKHKSHRKMRFKNFF